MNATQALGLAAFGIATLACGLAARRAGRARGVWVCLALIYLLLTLDIAFDLRFIAKGWVTERVRAEGGYDDRRSVQPFIIAGLAVVLALAGWALARTLRRSGAAARIAALGAVGTLFVVGTETISLHAVDAILWQEIGPVKLIALLWAGTAAVVAACAVSAGRRRG